MKIIDLTPKYIKYFIEDDIIVNYHQSYPALFDHYYRYWSDLNYHAGAFDKESVIENRNRIVAYLKKHYANLVKFSNLFKEMKLVLFVGDGISNGHAFSDNGEWIVWIPVETYNNSLDIEVFLNHELVHGIHYKSVPEFYFQNKNEKNLVSRQLICEGVATLITKELTGLADDEVLWGNFLSPTKRKAWYETCLENMESLKKLTKEKYYTFENNHNFFKILDRTEVLKSRTGYFIGLKLIEQHRDKNNLSNDEILKIPRHEFEDVIYQML